MAMDRFENHDEDRYHKYDKPGAVNKLSCNEH